MSIRLRAVGPGDESFYSVLLTHALVADVPGLSGPDVNRMIRCPRDEALATVERKRVVTADMRMLSALAGFDERHRIRPAISGPI